MTSQYYNVCQLAENLGILPVAVCELAFKRRVPVVFWVDAQPRGTGTGQPPDTNDLPAIDGMWSGWSTPARMRTARGELLADDFFRQQDQMPILQAARLGHATIEHISDVSGRHSRTCRGLRVTAQDLFIENAGVRLLAQVEGWDRLIHAPPPTLALPNWATWSALAAMLDPQHRNHAPELAVAVQAWVTKHVDPTADVTTVAVAKFAATCGASKGKGGAADRIATVANPGRSKRGGAKPTICRVPGK